MYRHFLLFILFYFLSPLSHAWGERGHDLITRVAVKNLSEISGFGKQFTEPFEQRDHMLSHLSNAPDFHWRADYMSDVERRLNSPTHYIGMETYLTDIDGKLPFGDFQRFVAQAKSKSISEPAWVGTAPWRILQFYKLMVSALKKANHAKSNEAMVAATNQALLYAGLMSHFVGDVANPHHTTTNHNGQLSGNTGLHAYFEGDIVRALPLSLAQDIGEMAKQPLLDQLAIKKMPPEQRQRILNDPVLLISSLIENSFANVDRLTQLDNQVSIIEKSTDDETDAVRKAPELVASLYQPFVVERMALGAAVLARLWSMAWIDAGKPNLANFHSYHYHLSPNFIKPDYLTE